MTAQTINTVDDVLALCGVSKDDAQERGGIQEYFSRHVYKNTDCGAWARIVYDPDNSERHGVFLGSIVEGSNATIAHEPLWFPFPTSDFWRAIKRIERWCDIEWKQVNERGGWPDGSFNDEGWLDNWWCDFDYPEVDFMEPSQGGRYG